MISVESLLITGLSLYLAGILITMFFPGKNSLRLFALFGGIGSLSLFVCGTVVLLTDDSFHASWWFIPSIGALSVSIDRLAAFFLSVTALVAMPASIFASNRLQRDKYTCPHLSASLYLMLLISLVVIVIASNVFLFLVAWELMSVFIYLMITMDGKERPGYLMLSIGESGTLAILVALLLLAGSVGTLSFDAIRAGNTGIGAGIRWAVFLLSFFGFGIKAGLIPLNFWVSQAYVSAPSAFIPLIAGATLNMGLYGIVRINASVLPVTQTAAGIIILITGTLTALIGILYATIENDFKAMLAHSSIENAGIIITAFGAGLLFVANGHRVAAAMAFIASLYHLLNHSVFKTLLFMGAGEAEASARTRDLDRLGGLLKRMPWTGLFVLVGALSISAMPPFNGFVSEWLTLQALLRSVEMSSFGVKVAFVTAGAGLALTAGLVVTCFVRAFAMTFLGMPRSDVIQDARETGRTALVPMAFLAFVCLALGVLPTYVIPVIDRAVAPITHVSGADALVPPLFYDNDSKGATLPKQFVADFHDVGAQIGKDTMPGRGLAVIHRGGEKNPVVFVMSTSYMFVTLIFMLVISVILVHFVVGRFRKVEYRPRWDGGVRQLLPEMTYTATGFAQPVRVIFEAVLATKTVDRQKTIAEHFRMAVRRKRREVHLVDRLILRPFASAAMWVANVLARMHGGKINTYAGYVLFALILFLIIATAT